MTNNALNIPVEKLGEPEDGWLSELAAYTMINNDSGYCEVCVVCSSSATLSNKFLLPFLLTFQIGTMQPL